MTKLKKKKKPVPKRKFKQKYLQSKLFDFQQQLKQKIGREHQWSVRKVTGFACINLLDRCTSQTSVDCNTV